MKTDVLTPMQVFNLPQRLVVPLFQRKYVWTQEGQWELLWDDIRRLTELRLRDPDADAEHFLGAAVLQEQFGRSGALPEWTVIDGQQRLTTLQLIIDAAGGVMHTLGLERLSRRMGKLTTNSEEDSDDPEDQFKVLPTNRDRAAFQEVMSTAPPVNHAALTEPHSLISKAHDYFSRVIREWITAAGQADESAIAERSEQLTQVVQRGLQLVVINLGRDEDAQEIFETLNARGTPLTAADLIKNFVFRKLAAESADIERAYQDHWQIFEDPFWEKEVSVGRYLTARSSLFLNQWLIAHVGEEVGPRATFSRFKHFVDHEFAGSMLELVDTLHRQATLYQRWTERSQDPHADLDQVELFVYRTADLEFAKPVLLWVFDVDRPLPDTVASAVVASVESWVMRRALLGLTTADLGRIVADLIRIHRPLSPDVVAGSVATFLSQLDRVSTYWPGDDAIRQGLTDLPAYRRFRRGRLRTFLEAAEDHARGFTDGRPAKTTNRVPRGLLQIEHLLPQQWRANWPVDGLSAEIARDNHVHRLGNLTLITGSLNAAVSNGPWLGADGKLSQLDRHDVLLLNRWIKQHGAQEWNEQLIDNRTQLLTDALLVTWPAPAGHLGAIVDATPPPAGYVELKELIAAGLLAPGTVLDSRAGASGSPQAQVMDDGRLQVGSDSYESPSGAARAAVGHAVNGWTFWRLSDGRALADLRNQFVSRPDDSECKESP